MTDLSPLGGSSGGVWTRTQALQLVTPAVVRSALRSGAWRVVWPGVYADGGYELTAEQRCWAACWRAAALGSPYRGAGLTTCPLDRASVCERWPAVARQRGCGACPSSMTRTRATGAWERVLDDVAVWSHLPAVHHEGWVLRRHRLHLNAEDLVRTATGLYITSPLRTLVHCCRLLTPEAAVCMLDHALHSGLVQRADLVRAVEARAGSPGVDDLRRAVSYADGRAESCAETLTRLLVLPVMPGLEPQVELRDDRGRVVARFDLADRARRFAVETDGKAGHSGPVMVAKDRARDVRTERYGWCTERVTWFDVRRRQRETLDRLTYRVAMLDRRSG